MKKPISLPKYFLLLVMPLVFIFPVYSFAQEKDQPAPPQTIEELKTAVEKVMDES